MVHTEGNKATQVVTITYSDHVSGEELKRHLEEIRKLLEEMEPGFRFLTDLSKLESMDMECVPQLAQIMEFANQQGIGAVFRVVPDPKKDIGFTVLSRFHYDPKVKLTTFETLDEALELLSTS